MGKIETVLKSEIVRLAGKEIRSLCGPMARDVRRLSHIGGDECGRRLVLACHSPSHLSWFKLHRMVLARES